MMTLHIKKLLLHCIYLIFILIFVLAFASCGASTFVRGTTSLTITAGTPYDFGFINVGSTYNVIFTLRNSGQANAINISASALTPPYTYTGGTYPGTTGTCASSLIANQTCTIDVTLSPIATGTLTDSIIFSFQTASVTGLSYTFNMTSYAKVPGSLDLSFNTTGQNNFATPWHGAFAALQQQTDGKFIAAGYESDFGANYRTLLARFLNTGELDSTFGVIGYVQPTFYASNHDLFSGVQIQPDGKIVAGGGSYDGALYYFAAARYDTNGNLDTTFNGTGLFTTSLSAGLNRAQNVGLQTDGKIVLSGLGGAANQWAVVRLDTSGALDTTFNLVGSVQSSFSISDRVHTAAIQSDGSIVVAGHTTDCCTEESTIGRYATDGSLDTTYNLIGYNNFSYNPGTDTISGMRLQSDGKAVAVGYGNNGLYNDATIARFNTDGSLDTSFNGTGKVRFDVGYATYGSNLAIQSDGKIVLVGSTNNGVSQILIARFHSNGSVDTTFNTTGYVEHLFGTGDEGYSILVQSDGKYVICGYTVMGGFRRPFIARIWY